LEERRSRDLLLKVRILSTNAVAAKAASVSNFSLNKEVTTAVKINTWGKG
jgi:hypothetical protein